MTTLPWEIYGSFELDKHQENSWENLFRAEVERHNGLDTAIGVYVIVSTSRKRDKIRYIGMTFDQNFTKEIFSQSNRLKVWNTIYDERNSTIKIWLFAKPNSRKNGFSKDSRLYRQAHLLEQLLIMHARAAGHNLINTKKMKSADGIAVMNLFGAKRPGKKSTGTKAIAKALKLA